MGAIPLVEISGEPRERGEQYGEQVRDRIAAAIAYYTELFASSAGLTWAEVCDRARLWMPLVEDFAPDVVAEMHGIAAGAGVGPLDILALNARGEIVYDQTFASMGQSEETDGCSSFALLAEASGDGHVYSGQNWDWRAGVAETTLALRIVQPPKPTIITTVEAGQVGRHGANSAGIALNANGLGGRFDNSIGVPQTFIRRKILDSARFTDAIRVAVTVRQQIAANLLLTHRDGVSIDLETTPKAHHWLYPERDLLVHTNHYRDWVPEQLKADYRPGSTSSLYRLPRLEKLLSRCRESAEPRKLIAEALSDHFGYPNALCAHPDDRLEPVHQHQTIASCVMDLTTGEFMVAAGPPCQNEFETLPWNIYDGMGVR